MTLHGVICVSVVSQQGMRNSQTGFLQMSLASNRVPGFVSVGEKSTERSTLKSQATLRATERSFPTGMVKVAATLVQRDAPSEWKEEEKRKYASAARRRHFRKFEEVCV